MISNSGIPFERVMEFVTEFDPKLVFSPSQADKPELNERAERLLGEPVKTIKLEFKTSEYFYITKNNMNEVREITDKYRIHLDLLVNWLDGVSDSPSIEVNNHGWVVNVDRPEMFQNESPQEMRTKQLTEVEGFRRPKHLPIKEVDAGFIRSLRIKHEDLAGVLHEVDRLISRKKRRERGVFWTETDISDTLATELMEITKPDYVVEPCVGGGSLIRNIIPTVKGAMNDISIAHVNNCKRIYNGYDWKFTNLDVVNTSTEELIRAWDIPKGKTLLIYTNPPFGTAATNRLVSRRLRNAFPHAQIFNELRFSHPRSNVEISFKTIYLHTFSYAGTRTAFKRLYVRANIPPLKIDYFLRVKKWIVENMDFRDLMTRYNKPKVMLYMDPPYLDGGQTYRYSFKMNDFLDLKKLLDQHQGTFTC